MRPVTPDEGTPRLPKSEWKLVETRQPIDALMAAIISNNEGVRHTELTGLAALYLPIAANISSTLVNLTRGRPWALPLETSISSRRSQSSYAK